MLLTHNETNGNDLLNSDQMLMGLWDMDVGIA